MSRAWWTAAGLLLLSGCGDDGCPSLSRCDITRVSCQRRIAATVGCMRGGSVDLPKVTLLDEDGLRSRLEEDDDASEEDEAEYTRWNRGLSLFDLAPADYTRDAARSDWLGEVAAVYFFDEKEIVVVDHGEPLDSVEAVSTFAHELVHALQDAEHDLGAYYDTWSNSYDSSLAIRGLVEGEADLYSLLVNIELRGISSDEVDWRDFFHKWQSEVLNEAEKSVAPVAQASMHFPYAFGAGFVLQHWLDGGRPRIERLFQAPPRSTREVLFGASDVDFDAEASALMERAVPALEAPFENSDATSLGAWITRVFAGKQRLSVAQRLAPARALTADEFSVHYNPETDQVVAAWRVRAETEAAAEAWPGRNSRRFQSVLESDQPEVAMLGVDGSELELDAVAWQAPAPAEDEEEGEAARGWVQPPWKLFRGETMLACHRQRWAPRKGDGGDDTH